MNDESIDISLIGATIKALRCKAKMSQEELADLSGYSIRNIRRIEQNGTENISVVNLFADIFGISPLDILTGCLPLSRCSYNLSGGSTHTV